MTDLTSQRFDILEHRYDALARRVEEIESKRSSASDKLTELRVDVSYLKGALTEIRWTNRAILLIVAGLLVRLAL